jgi:2-aminoethylphosphonate-pyruvate transaminase
MDAHTMRLVVSAAQEALDEMDVTDGTPPQAALEERKRLLA